MFVIEGKAKGEKTWDVFPESAGLNARHAWERFAVFVESRQEDGQCTIGLTFRVAEYTLKKG